MDLLDILFVVKCNFYVYLIFFNVVVVISVMWVIEWIVIVFDVVGGILDVIYVLGVMFFISVY